MTDLRRLKPTDPFNEMGTIDVCEVCAGIIKPAHRRTFRHVEALHLRLVLESVNGNRMQAGAIVGVHAKTIGKMIVRYKIGAV